MSKTKSITDLVTELQLENESLQSLKKLANQFCKKEFGYNMVELHDIVTRYEVMEKRSAEKQGQHIQFSHSENELR